MLAGGSTVYSNGGSGVLQRLQRQGTDWVETPFGEGSLLNGISCDGDVISLPGGKRIAVGGGVITLCDVGGDTEPAVLPGASGTLLACSPSGRRLVVVGTHRAQVWSLKPHQLLTQLMNPLQQERPSRLYGAAYSPDGTLIALADHDCTVSIWSARTFELVSYFFMWDRAYQPEFTRDGQYVLCGGDDKTVGLWHAGTGELVTRMYLGAGVGMVRAGLGSTLVAGDDLGRVNFLALVNCEFDAPVATCMFVWDHDAGTWEKAPTVVCPHTGERFEPPADVLRILHDNGLAADCPAARLPSEAFSDDRLLLRSPFCDGMVSTIANSHRASRHAGSRPMQALATGPLTLVRPRADSAQPVSGRQR